ncbi:MAG: inositol monophosphatase [Gammaproteobacteria bacterium]|nr:inositol monophosphatase [Gammaproteobacteria bacterium]
MKNYPTLNYPTLDELAATVKQVAGRVPALQTGRVDHTTKLDGSFVTAIDQQMQEELLDSLTSRWAGFGAIGEEMKHADQMEVTRHSEQGYWVIDPLDGTTNFISGFLFYGISVALVVEGNPILAVVYDPVRDEIFSAEAGNGAYLNGERLSTKINPSIENCIANVDYKRLVGDLSAQLVRCPPYRSQRNLGASVLEWCWLAAGRFQLYLHGGQKLWDFAAGYLILKEAGGAATSLSGKPLNCGSLRKRSVVAAITPALLTQWKSWIETNCNASGNMKF